MHEHIERHIHEHDIHHRILPIVDIKVLPTRHFQPRHGVPARQDGAYDGTEVEEMPDWAIPKGRVGEYTKWVVAETVSQFQQEHEAARDSREVKLWQANGRRNFSARQFPDELGKYEKTYVREAREDGEDGLSERVPVQETTWVHEPVVSTGAKKAGITEGVRMGTGSERDQYFSNGGAYPVPSNEQEEADGWMTPLGDLQVIPGRWRDGHAVD